jgi:ATP-dependent Zn protease
MPGDSRGLAYHEAGHAVVAWALSLHVIGISFGTKGDGGLNTLLDEAYPPSLFQALVINQGAAAAEDLFKAPTRSLARMWDRYQAEQQILLRLKRKKSRAMEEAYQRAQTLLQVHSDRAKRVAEYLIEHGTIDAATAAVLLPPKEA